MPGTASGSSLLFGTVFSGDLLSLSLKTCGRPDGINDSFTGVGSDHRVWREFRCGDRRNEVRLFFLESKGGVFP